MKPSTFTAAMKQSSRNLLLSTVMITAVQVNMSAQDYFQVNSNTNITEITVSGTSNIHDWNMTSPTLTCTAQISYDNGIQTLNVSKLDFSVPVKTLKSGKGKMDDKTYTALKANKYNAISFKLISATAIPYKKDAFNIQSTGTLTIAGVTRQIDLTVACQLKPDGNIVCAGSKKLKMTDYNVEPPTALLGTIASGNDITISFILDLKKSTTNPTFKTTSLIN